MQDRRRGFYLVALFEQGGNVLVLVVSLLEDGQLATDQRGEGLLCGGRYGRGGLRGAGLGETGESGEPGESWTHR